LPRREFVSLGWDPGVQAFSRRIIFQGETVENRPFYSLTPDDE
jgi:hypothetical protein